MVSEVQDSFVLLSSCLTLPEPSVDRAPMPKSATRCNSDADCPDRESCLHNPYSSDVSMNGYCINKTYTEWENFYEKCYQLCHDPMLGYSENCKLREKMGCNKVFHVPCDTYIIDKIKHYDKIGVFRPETEYIQLLRAHNS